MRTCIHCHETKDESLFKVQRNHIGGKVHVGNVCKLCANHRNKLRRKLTREANEIVPFKKVTGYKTLTIEQKRKAKEVTAQMIAEIMISPVALERLRGPDK